MILNLIPKRTVTTSESSYQMISSQLSVDLEKQGRVKQIFPEKLNPTMISRLQQINPNLDSFEPRPRVKFLDEGKEDQKGWVVNLKD